MRIFALLFLPLLILSTSIHDLQAQAGRTVSLDKLLNKLSKAHNITISFEPGLLAHYKVSPPPDSEKPSLNTLQALLQGLPLAADSVAPNRFIIKPRPAVVIPRFRELRVTVKARPEERGSTFEYVQGAEVFYRLPGGKHVGTFTQAHGEATLKLADGYVPESVYIRMVNYKHVVLRVTGPHMEVLLKPLSTGLVEITDRQQENTLDQHHPLTWSVQEPAPKSLRHFPSPGGSADATSSLQLMHGIASQNETPGQTSIRGGTPDQSLVQLDGITLYSNSHIPSVAGRVPAHIVRASRVILGGMPVRYGNRLSGVIEFLGQPKHTVSRRDQSDAEATLGVDQLSAFGHGRFSHKEGKASLFVSARRSLTDVLPPAFSAALLEQQLQRGILFRDQQSGEAEYPRFRFYDVYVKGVIAQGDKDIVNITFFGAHDALRYQRPAGGLPSSARDSLAFGQWGSSVRWDRTWSPLLHSTFQVNYTRFASQYDYRYALPAAALLSSYRQQSDLSDFSFQQEHRLQLGDSSALSFGIQGTWLSAFYQQANQEQYGAYQQRDSSGGFARSGLYALFAEYRRPLLKHVNLSVGSRLSYYTATQRLYPEPRFAISWHPGKHIALSLRGGTYWQFTSRALQLQDLGIGEELWMLAGQDSLRPAMGRDLIAGLLLGGGGAWTFQFDLYARQQRDITAYDLEFDPLTLETKPSTGRRYQGDAQIFGMDATVTYREERHEAWVSYTLSKVSQRFDEIAEGQAFAAGHDQRHRFKAAHDWKVSKHWNLNSSWLLSSGTPYTEVAGFSRTAFHGRELFFLDFSSRNTGRLPAYHRLNLSIRRTIQPPHKSWSAVCGFALNNVYGRRNVQARRFWVARSEAGDLALQTEDIRLAGLTPSFFIHFSL